MSSLPHANHLLGADSVDVTREVWIRNRRRTRGWTAVAVLWSVVFASLLFVSGDLRGHPTAAESIGVSVFYLGIAALGLAFAARVTRAGVWIGPDAVVVRGPFRTRSVPIAEAQRFVPGLQGGAGNGVPCPLLNRQGARPVGVWALGRRNVWFRYDRLCAEIQPLCDQLTELVIALQPETHSSSL